MKKKRLTARDQVGPTCWEQQGIAFPFRGRSILQPDQQDVKLPFTTVVPPYEKSAPETRKVSQHGFVFNYSNNCSGKKEVYLFLFGG